MFSSDVAPTLEDAIRLAAVAHTGQFDKAGEAYILHPLRVMLRLSDPDERMAAVLHDVVEDSEVTLDDLQRAKYPAAVVAAVAALTRREGEDYFDFVRRAASHPVARAVKRADLLENLDVTRLATVTPRDEERMAKYRRALAILEADD